jgi:Ca-activated chloride channel family protein
LGLGYDELLLSAIAKGGAGNELFAETADDAVKSISGEVTGLLSLAAQAGCLLIRMSPFVRAVQVINDLSTTATQDGLLVELGSFYSGEARKLVLTFDVPGIPALGLTEVATLEFSYVALPSLEHHTVEMPLHVNVVPGDQAAGRLPDPVVRTELAFQKAQRSKREASTALSEGNTARAMQRLKHASCLIDAAVAGAPAELAGMLTDELADISRLVDETEHGDVLRAAKLSSMDATFKSRNRGRTRPPTSEDGI